MDKHNHNLVNNTGVTLIAFCSLERNLWFNRFKVIGSSEIIAN